MSKARNFKLYNADFGTALYQDGDLVALWDAKEEGAYIEKQLKLRMERGDLITDGVPFEGSSFPSSLPKPKPAPKPKSKSID
jgi:hypothetical protein